MDEKFIFVLTEITELYIEEKKNREHAEEHAKQLQCALQKVMKENGVKSVRLSNGLCYMA